MEKLATSAFAKLEEQLWVAARCAADEAGYAFSVPCAHIVRDLIRAGVRNMAREGRADEAGFDEAAAHLTELVLAMVRAAKAMPDTRPSLPGPRLIREGAVVQAKSELCLLWPFC